MPQKSTIDVEDRESETPQILYDDEEKAGPFISSDDIEKPEKPEKLTKKKVTFPEAEPEHMSQKILSR